MTRKLKVIPRSTDRKHQPAMYVPAIILTGFWLRQCGYEIGEQLEINITNDEIVITKIKNTTTVPSKNGNRMMKSTLRS